MKSPLPLVDGIAPSYIWLPPGQWPGLLSFLTARFSDIGEAAWRSRMARGLVVDGQGQAQGPDSPYQAGACIHYYRELDAEPAIPFRETVLYRDDHILVADKPHFLPVMPAGRFLQETLLVRLRRLGGLDDLAPVHRIDRETAGVVLFSVNPDSRDAYAALFRERRVSKVYEAVAAHRPELVFPLTRRSRLEPGEPFFRMQEVAGEANSETAIDVLERRGDLTRYRVEPVSGRKHQIRVHFAGLGMPILNDRFYPQVLAGEETDYANPLQLLARSLSFVDPVSGEARHVVSRLHL